MSDPVSKIALALSCCPCGDSRMTSTVFFIVGLNEAISVAILTDLLCQWRRRVRFDLRRRSAIPVQDSVVAPMALPASCGIPAVSRPVAIRQTVIAKVILPYMLLLCIQ